MASDRAGLAPAVKSEQGAFEALFKSEYARVAGIANRVLSDPQEAEDVAQEVFMDFHRLHSAGSPYAASWLYRAAAHTALNRIRGRRRRQRREQANGPHEGSKAVDPQQGFEGNENRPRVREALARPPQKTAALLVLRAGGRSH